jgi:methionine biosynthesis protein MetW
MQSNGSEASAPAWSPDENAKGLLAGEVDPLRYDGHTDDLFEVAGMMRAAIPNGARVLDVGCGTGGLTEIVTRGKDASVVGIEPDKARAALAAERGLEVFGGTLDESFVDSHDPFDVVIFADVLEHLPAPAAILALAARALRPGGIMLISVPNVAHWSIRGNLLVGRFDYEPYGLMDSTHLRWFTKKSIKSLVEDAGLQVATISQSAGTTLPVYQRTIFRRIPRRLLSPAVRACTRVFPLLFGSQHVVVARKLSA